MAFCRLPHCLPLLQLVDWAVLVGSHHSGKGTSGRSANAYTQHPRMGPQQATDCHWALPPLLFLHFSLAVGVGVRIRVRESELESSKIGSVKVM